MRSVVGDLTDGRTVTVVWTDRADGDFATPADDRTSASIRRRIADRPWVWARQVHGREVVIVDDGPWSDRCGREADALVTRRDDLVLEVRTFPSIEACQGAAERDHGAPLAWREAKGDERKHGVVSAADRPA